MILLMVKLSLGSLSSGFGVIHAAPAYWAMLRSLCHYFPIGTHSGGKNAHRTQTIVKLQWFAFFVRFPLERGVENKQIGCNSSSSSSGSGSSSSSGSKNSRRGFTCFSIELEVNPLGPNEMLLG